LLNALVTPRSREALIKEFAVKRPQLLDALLEVGLAANELQFKNGLFRIKGRRFRAIMESNGDMLPP